MRQKPLLQQFYPLQLLLIGAILAVMTWSGHYLAARMLFQQSGKDLAARATLARERVIELLADNDPAELQRFCRQAGRAAATRLTVIAPDGTVLADSDADPTRMDNHGDRPELIAALANGQPSPPVRRFSYTLNRTMLYVAVPLHHDGRVLGVLRSAQPLALILQPLRKLTFALLTVALLTALTAATLAWLILRRQVLRPLHDLRQAAAQFAAGNLGHRLAVSGPEEVTSLAEALASMARQLDQRLRTVLKQHNELEAVFSSMVEGVLTVDQGERIRSMNRACSSLLGLDPARATGKTTQEAIRNSELQRFVKRALTTTTPIEGELVLPAGNRERHFFAHGLHLQDENRASSGALIVLNDITNLKRLENIRRDFVANVSHELKTPITSIEGFVETLLDGALEEPNDARRFLTIIATQARRLHAIVEDLLALSRIEQEGQSEQIVRSETRLKAPLRAAIQTCTAKAGERGTLISLQCPEDLTARINPALLEQALVNLIDNAVKYSPDQSKVLVTAEATDQEVTIAVRDQGVGIAPEDQPRLFERFYRVDKARSAKLGGTGLGLSIVKHIVQAHKGTVSVESVLGRGSTFTIILPRQENRP